MLRVVTRAKPWFLTVGPEDGSSATALFSFVSHCSKRHQKTTISAIKTVAASSVMLPLVTAQTVASAVGSEDAFCEGEHMAGKLKPLDIERKIRRGKFCAL
jgi:hypothetical protein